MTDPSDPNGSTAQHPADFTENKPQAQTDKAHEAIKKEVTGVMSEPGWERATLEKLAFASLNE